jgi:uncharacterized protein YjbJ (UPF0337 family)
VKCMVMLICDEEKLRLLYPLTVGETMNTLNIKGNWNEISGKLKQKYAKLTDDDLLFKEGKEEELMGRLQQKLGTTKEGLRDLIAKL